MRRLPVLVVVLVVVLALLATACGGDDSASPAGDDTTTVDSADDTGAADDTADDTGAADDTADDTGAADDTADDTDAPVELTASWTGVTEDTILIGAAGIDLEAVEAFGVELAGIDSSKAVPAFAAALNEAGGVHGRMVDVAVELFLPVGSVESELACTILTEDLRVFAVVGQMLGDNPLCFTELHDTPYIGSFGLTEERGERSNGQFYAYEMQVEEQRDNAIELLAGQGRFDGARVGLFWEVADKAIVDELVRPLLDASGVDVVSEAQLDEFGGDTAASEAAADAIFQRFIADDTDLLINVSGLVSFNRAVERNFYEGQLVYLNGQQTNESLVGTSGYDPDILIGAYGATAGKPTKEELLEDELWLDCVDDLNTHGDFDEPFVPEDLTASEARSIAQLCGTWDLLELMLEAAGPDLNPDTLRAGAESLGEIELPGLAAASLGPDDHSAGDAVRVFEYDPDAVVFVPVGDPIVVD